MPSNATRYDHVHRPSVPVIERLRRARATGRERHERPVRGTCLLALCVETWTFRGSGEDMLGLR